MLTKTQLLDILYMQERLEVHLDGVHWRQAGHNYALCIHMEAAELINHLPWKHWKDVNAEPNWDQVALELIDIFHFAMAHLLMSIESAAMIPELCDVMHSDLNDTVSECTDTPLDVPSLAIGLSYSMFSRGLFPYGNFISLMQICGMDFDQLYLLYCCKNVLNRFRYTKGYKEGLYLKTWAGREDNEHLMDIANDMSIDDINFDVLYTTLEKRYQLAVH